MLDSNPEEINLSESLKEVSAPDAQDSAVKDKGLEVTAPNMGADEELKELEAFKNTIPKKVEAPIAKENKAEEIKELDSLNEPTPPVTVNKESNKSDELDLMDTLEKSPELKNANEISAKEELDDLQSLKEDIGEVVFKKKKDSKLEEDLNETSKSDNVTSESDDKLLKDLATNVKKKMPNSDWWELGQKSKLGKYEVQKGEDLASIAKKLFGNEMYYSKIWALNPQITNPYNVEPGTILSFDMGTVDGPPNVLVGEFASGDELSDKLGSSNGTDENKERKDWIKERQKMVDQGVYFQFASEETYDDLIMTADPQKQVEYESYTPPATQFSIIEPSDEYDSSGVDRHSRIVFNYKEGFFLNTFVTTNMVQDLGEIKAARNENVFIHKYDTVYVTFDKAVKVKPGDLFTVYTAGGEVKHKISDRTGFLYTTTAQIKIVKKIDDVWECFVVEQSGIAQRKDRITVYTPRIGKISKTYTLRRVEAAIIGSYRDSISGLSFGDVVYIDRGRADGVELGNTFELYSNIDRGTQKKITPSPTYKIGELNVISITDNFATAIISQSSHEINVGSIAFAKTQEDAARDLKRQKTDKLLLKKEGKALDELDVELNLDDVNQDILNKADKIQLTEDEIEELDRQERDKSIIKDKERDVKELDRLETEILETEKALNESKVDEDKFLEQQSLEHHEKNGKGQNPNAFESINEIEKDIGRKYLDEDLNNKENPYGLTEYDLEEVDQLLNTGSKK